jgi:hypothetical protein
LLALIVLQATGLAACGGSDSGDSTSTPTGAGTGVATTPATPADKGSGETPISSPPAATTASQTFGEEADVAEVDAATAVLAGYLNARCRGSVGRSAASMRRYRHLGEG